MSIDLINHLLEQAQALTKQERRILASRLLEGARPASQDVTENADEPSVDVKYRKREYQWMKEHEKEYAGQWVALEGDRLIAHGASARQVLEEANKVGAKLPFFARIESPDDLSFGGW